MQLAAQKWFRIKILVFMLLCVGIFFNLFWRVWGRASKSFDHGQAELLLHMVTRALFLPAMFSIASFLLTWWCFRQETIFEPRKDRRYYFSIFAFVASTMAMFTLNGVYAGLTYAFYFERIFPLAPYEEVLGVAFSLYMMSVVALQVVVTIAMRRSANAAASV